MDELRDVVIDLPCGVQLVPGASGLARMAELNVEALSVESASVVRHESTWARVRRNGSVRLGGRELTRVPATRRPFNTVFQNYALFPHLDVAANIAFGLAFNIVAVIASGIEPADVLALDRDEARRRLAAGRDRLELGDGPVVLVEDVGLARACGRTALLHPFVMTSLAARGLWDPEPLATAIPFKVASRWTVLLS